MQPSPLPRRIFLSHAWGDSTPQAQRDHECVLALLQAAGLDPSARTGGWIPLPDPFTFSDGRQVQLEVFWDQGSIKLMAGLTGTLERRLGESHLLAACWSERYPTRAACMWEYVSAFFAEGGAHEPGRRVRVLPVGMARVAVTLRPSASVQERLLPDLDVQPPTDPASYYREVWQALAEAAAPLDVPLGELPELAPPAIGWAPSDLSHFVGREEELWTIYEALHAPGNAGAAALTGTGRAATGNRQGLVRGLGGIGKSMLAQVYAQRFGGAYPGGIFWLRAFGHDDVKGPISVEERRAERGRQLRDVAELLEVPLPDGADEAQVRRTLGQALAGRGAYLWIVDDLPSTVEAADKLHGWLAPSPNGLTLMTSRGRAVKDLGTEIPLDVLPPEAAYALLTREAPPDGPEEVAGARAVCEELGRHPLALAVAGALVASSASSRRYQGFKEELEGANKAEVLHKNADLVPQLPTGHEASILYTLERSLAQLDEGAMLLLRAASVLAPAPIQVALVEELLAGMMQDGWRATTALRTAGLADVEEGAMRVHTLVAHAAAARTRTEELGALRTLAQTQILTRLPDAADVRKHRRLSPWLPHARALVDETEAGLDVLGWVGRYDQERGDFGSAAMTFGQEWADRTALHGSAAPLSLTSRNNLAQALKSQGNFTEALAHERAVLKELARLLGSEHFLTLRCRNNIALTLRAQGDLAGAQTHLEAVWEAMARLLGPEHPDTLTTRHNLAGSFKAQGDLLTARTHLEFVCEARVRLLGAEHPDTLASRNNLAELLAQQGDLAGARSSTEAVLVARVHLLGPEHPDTLTSRNNLAVYLLSQGHLLAARSHAEAVWEARVRSLGPEHPDTLTSRNNLAGTLSAQGDLSGARVHLEAVWEARGRRLGSDHPDTLASRNNLAGTLSAQGDLFGARVHEEAVWEARGRLLGPEHPDTLASRNNLAQTLKAQGDLPGARVHEEAVWEARGRLLGSRHSDTTVAAWNLFNTLRRLQAPEADDVLQGGLSYLLDLVPEHLSHHQRQIQSMLHQMRAAGE